MQKMLSFLVLVWLYQTTGFGQVRSNPRPTSAWDGRAFLYFNGTIDSTAALPGNLANGLENLEQRVIDAINNANSSIDVAAYELNSLNIVVALCKAKERGLRVRLIVDDQAAPSNNKDLWKVARSLLEKRYHIVWMTDAGWPWVRSKSSYYKGHRAQMHHKFMVIDRLSSSPSDDVVLTGSYNYTITGMVSMQNLLVIHDPILAMTYETEFEQMWGSSADLPDSSKAAFHQYKKNLAAPSLRSGSSSIDVYFTPVSIQRNDDYFLQILARTILIEADHDIKICAFSFSTGINLDEAIRNKFESSSVSVQAIFEPSLANQPWSLYRAMTGHPTSKSPWKTRPDAFLAKEDRHLHHKYILIDADNPDTTDTPVVISGSLNFSQNANDENDENFLIIRDKRLANQYLQEFLARFKKAAGRSTEEVKDEGDPIDTD